MEIVFGPAIEGILKRAMSEKYLLPDYSDNIITLDLELDIGDIHQLPINDDRKRLTEASFYSDQWSYSDNRDFMPHWEKMKRECERFPLFAQAGDSARIWYSNTPASLCGFMYVVTELSKSARKISAVQLPSYAMEMYQNRL